MTPERWQQIESVFHAALERQPEERAAFLDQACGSDVPLRKEVEALLETDAEQESAVGLIPSLVAADWISEGENKRLVGQVIGRHRVLAPLGSGGMGDVYLAEDSTLGRKVALKLLPAQFTRDPERLRRFAQEARSASALNHPNIITIYEIGQWEETQFIAMEYIEGETLREHMRKGRALLPEILEIGTQVAGALAAAHAAGIVHRDIKPANIMVRTDGYVKVLDFGLAKLTATVSAQADRTDLGRVMGTINYMSPEQALGQPLDHRTDIFSLGVVLYEIATGQRLFEGKSEAAIYDSILHKNPPAVREFAPATPAEFDHVVQRALAKDPARRYQTAADLRADLKRLAQGTGYVLRRRTDQLRREQSRDATRQESSASPIGAAMLAALLAAALFFGGRIGGSRRAAEVPNEREVDRGVAV